jgi:hypothetical protein
MSRPQVHGEVGRKYVTEKSSDTTENRSRDRPTSSAAPQPLRHPKNSACISSKSNCHSSGEEQGKLSKWLEFGLDSLGWILDKVRNISVLPRF